MTDTLAERLAAVEYRGRIAYNDYDAPPRKDFDGLLAAVEAVLEVAGRWDVQAQEMDDGTGMTLTSVRAMKMHACALEIRNAITRTLTGEDSS